MIRTTAILLSLIVFLARFCAAQDQPAPAPPPSQTQQPPPPAAQQATAPAAQSAPASGAPQASTSDFRYFFTATGSAFEAYMDQRSLKADAEGNKLITIKLMKFSSAFRDWIKSNFPGGETADYATDSYSIDCEAKKVGEHEITWHDANGVELANYDFGGILNTPIVYSMKDNLMKKLCGIQ